MSIAMERIRINNILKMTSTVIGNIPNRTRPYRWPITILTAVLTVVMVIGAGRVTFDMTLDSWFEKSDSVIIALDEFRRHFGSDDGLFIVYKPKDGDVFSRKSLQLISNLEHDITNWYSRTPELKQLEHIVRIQTLTNINIQRNVDDSLISEKLVPHRVSIGSIDTDEIREKAFAQKDLHKVFFSEDSKYGGFTIQTDFGAIPIENSDKNLDPNVLNNTLDSTITSFEVDETANSLKIEFQDTDITSYADFMQDLNKILNKSEYQEHFIFYPTGISAMMSLANESMKQVGMLFLGLLLIIILLLRSLLGNVTAVVWPITAIVISVIWVLGFCGWTGVVLSQILGLTIMLILAVGIANCVHVMSAYIYYRQRDENHVSAMHYAYHKTGLPILLATITTMIGMLALTTNTLIQFKLFGYTAASGVGLAFIFTIFVLPALMDIWQPVIKNDDTKPAKWPLIRKYKESFSKLLFFPFRITGITYLLTGKWLQPLLNNIPRIVMRAPLVIALLFAGIGALLVYGIVNTEVNTNYVELYKEGTPFRISYDTVDQHMAGTAGLEILIDMGESNALLEPDVLHTMDRVQQLIEKDFATHVVRTFSLTNVVKDTHKVMTSDTDADFLIPNDTAVISQLLYLFNSSNPQDRRRLVSDDYSRTHITVQMRNAGSQEYEQYFSQLKTKIEKEFEPLYSQYPDLKISLTGSLAIMMKLSSYLAQQQFDSLLLAAIVISMVLFLTLGSLQAGLIGFLPNILPALFTFGILGLLSIPLDADTFMIAPLIIGIAVDDTIHFLTHYRMALQTSKDMAKALTDTIKIVGQAVTFTTLILGLGFFILSFSDYLGFAKIGMIGSTALFIALLCDLFFLPALLIIFKPKFGCTDAKPNFRQLLIQES